MAGKVEKAVIIDDVHGRFSKAQVVVVAEYRGLPVDELSALRGKLRSVGGEFKIVKNTLARRAAEGTALAAIGEHFDGPVGVAIGYQDPAPVAKVLKDFAGEQEKFKLRVGILEGRVLDVSGLVRVASLPSRQALLAQLVGQLQAPVSGLVGGLQGVLRKAVATLDAVAKKRAETPAS